MQKAAALASFAMVSSYTNLTFTEIDEELDGPAILRLSQTLDSDVASAMGYFPGPDYRLRRHLVRPHQPALLRHPREGELGLLHHHARDRAHARPQARPPGLHLPGPERLFRRRRPPRFGSRSTPSEHDGQAWTLMSYRSDPGAVGAHRVLGRRSTTSPRATCRTTSPLCSTCTAPTSTPTPPTASTPGPRPPARCPSTASAKGRADVQHHLPDHLGRRRHRHLRRLPTTTTASAVDLRPGGFSTVQRRPARQPPRLHRRASRSAPGNVANALLFQGDIRLADRERHRRRRRRRADRQPGRQRADRRHGRRRARGRARATTPLDGGAGSDTAVFYTNTAGVTVVLNDGAADIIVANDGYRHPARASRTWSAATATTA